MSALLEVKGLVKHYGSIAAADGIDFDVAVGELVALIGPNGAGKSTCFNLINGQLRPDSGQIRLEGQSIVGEAPHRLARKGLARTFQVAAVFASMTLLENLQLAWIAHHRRNLALWVGAGRVYREESMTLLDSVGMADQEGRPASELAYGDVKRLELALALVGTPKLILMDEPMAGMAPGERSALMSLIAQLVEDKGFSILFTEHDMGVVFEHAQRILVLDRGRIIGEGPPELIREDPRVREVYLGRNKGA